MITMNNTQYLYIISKRWIYTSLIFFTAIALIVMDIRFIPGLMATSLITSIFLLIFYKLFFIICIMNFR